MQDQKDIWSRPVKQLINYINNRIWVNDQDKLQLKTIQIQLNQSITELSKISIVARVKDQASLDLLSQYIYQNLRKVRQINHSLQAVFSSCNRVETKLTPQAPVSCEEKMQNQIYKIYRSVQGGVSALHYLTHNIDDMLNLVQLLGPEGEVSKKHSIYRVFDMFKFEINCLKNEIRNTTHARDEIQPQILVKLSEIDDDQIMQWIYAAIDNELKVKSSLSHFSVILERLLSPSYNLNHLEYVQINLDDQSDLGSKETQISLSDRKPSFTSLFGVSPKSPTHHKQDVGNEKIKRKTADYHNKLIAFPTDRQKSAEFIYLKELSKDKIPIQNLPENKLVDGSETCLKISCNLF